MSALRNPNTQWEGVLVLLDKCLVRQGATATPVWRIQGGFLLHEKKLLTRTSRFQDIILSLRLLRDPKMIGDAGLAQGQILDQMERAASKLWTQGDSMEEFATILATKRAEAQGNSPLSPEGLAQAVEQILNMEKKNLCAFFVSYRCLSHIKKHLGSQIIHRDFRSLDQHGRKVLNLLPYVESLVHVQLEDIEQKAIGSIANRRPNAV
ncbi:hypothetical protein FRC06_002749 [Ceratobasidium sp. 370]|nr:hypothetical protein FRC06_002749 [Ceratobasidium sp. 370]